MHMRFPSHCRLGTSTTRAALSPYTGAVERTVDHEDARRQLQSVPRERLFAGTYLLTYLLFTKMGAGIALLRLVSSRACAAPSSINPRPAGSVAPRLYLIGHTIGCDGHAGGCSHACLAHARVHPLRREVADDAWQHDRHDAGSRAERVQRQRGQEARDDAGQQRWGPGAQPLILHGASTGVVSGMGMGMVDGVDTQQRVG